MKKNLFNPMIAFITTVLLSTSYVFAQTTYEEDDLSFFGDISVRIYCTFSNLIPGTDNSACATNIFVNDKTTSFQTPIIRSSLEDNKFEQVSSAINRSLQSGLNSKPNVVYVQGPQGPAGPAGTTTIVYQTQIAGAAQVSPTAYIYAGGNTNTNPYQTTVPGDIHSTFVHHFRFEDMLGNIAHIVYVNASSTNTDNLNFQNATGTNLTATGTVTTVNLIGSNATFTNSTTTNFFSEKASLTNATTTSLFAVLANIWDIYFNNATGTNLQVANATTTNFAATGTAFLTEAYVASSTQINSSILSGNATLTDLFSTRASITEATTTYLFAAWATFMNLLINDLLFGNATGTSLVVSNLYATNTFALAAGTINSATITSATTTNLASLFANIDTLTSGVINATATINTLDLNATGISAISNLYATTSVVDSLSVGNIFGLSGVTTVTGDLIPSTSSTYNLGSLTHPWKDLYVSSSTVYFNGVPLSTKDGYLTFGGTPVALSTTSASTTFGSLAVSDTLILSSSTPSTTTDALYNLGGILYWNGKQVGTSGENSSSTIFTIYNIVATSSTVTSATTTNFYTFNLVGDTASVAEAKFGSSTITMLNFQNVFGNSITSYEANLATASIYTLNSYNLVTQILSVVNAFVDTLEVGSILGNRGQFASINTSNLIATGTIALTYLNATNTNIDNLVATDAWLKNLTSPFNTLYQIYAGDITSTSSIRANDLTATGNTNLENLIAINATITNATLTNATFTKVYADLIETDEVYYQGITGLNATLTNATVTNALVAKFNADEITTNALVINGQMTVNGNIQLATSDSSVNDFGTGDRTHNNFGNGVQVTNVVGSDSGENYLLGSTTVSKIYSPDIFSEIFYALDAQIDSLLASIIITETLNTTTVNATSSVGTLLLNASTTNASTTNTDILVFGSANGNSGLFTYAQATTMQGVTGVFTNFSATTTSSRNLLASSTVLTNATSTNWFATNATVTDLNVARVTNTGGLLTFGTESGNEISFIQNNSEFMHVQTNGEISVFNRLALGRTNPSVLLHVGSSTMVTGTVARFQTTSGTCNIDPLSGLSCSSDERLKKNISEVTWNALEKLSTVNVREYNLRSQEEGGKKQVGFIAQNLENIFPWLVGTDEEGMKTVSYANMSPILVLAVQELNTKIDQLSSRVVNSFDALSANKISSKKVQMDEFCVGSQCFTEDDMKEFRSYLDSKKTKIVETQEPVVVKPEPEPEPEEVLDLSVNRTDTVSEVVEEDTTQQN